MTDSDAPSRRDFEHLSAAVVKLTETIERLPEIMEKTYVRRDVYESDQKLQTLKHASQDEEIDNLNSWRDMVLKIVIAAVLTSLLGVVLVQGGVIS